MRHYWVVFVISAVVLLPTRGNAQPDRIPEPPPLVTAANADWQIRGEPIFYAGNFYWPTGPTVFFDGSVMVRTGQYEGVPLYANPFHQPYSVVYVPIGGVVVRPYERRRPGPGMVGALGSPIPYVTPNPEPVVLPERVTAEPRPVGTAGTIVPRPTGDRATLPVERQRPQRSIVRSVPEPRANAGVWLMFNGARYDSAGPAVPFSADRFISIGQHRGFPVYRDNNGRSDEIFVSVVKDGPLAPYRR